MMPSIWRPFRELERVNRLFDEFFSRIGQRLPEVEFLREGWSPPVDVVETDKELIVKIDLPGVAKNDIHLEIKENSLSIHGERTMPGDTLRENYLQLERAYGKFERTLVLPRDVEADKAQARLEEGVLEITLPKTERAMRKHITIE